MKTYALAVLAATTLAGCAGYGATSKQIFLPEGNVGFTINCDGQDSDWGACYDEAGKICGPYGYKKIEKTYEKGRDEEAYGVYKAGRTARGRTTHNRNLIITCGAGWVPATVSATTK